MEHTKRVAYIFGGGTFAPIRPHFSLAAPAFGGTMRILARMVREHPLGESLEVMEVATAMAGGPTSLATTSQLADKVDEVITSPLTKLVFFTCAVCDFEPAWMKTQEGGGDHGFTSEFGHGFPRMTSTYAPELSLRPTPKLVPRFRRGRKDGKPPRKDIFVVAFKTTTGATPEGMYLNGLKLCKEASANLVLVNDLHTRHNMIVTPEEAAYHETTNREEALFNLVDMALYRSQLAFTRSNVVEGVPVKWDDHRVPESLRTVVDYLISGSAYKPFQGSTVGHFAVKMSSQEFLTSIRRSNFNDLDKVGLVYVRTNGPDEVTAYGAKPSVGGQSQRIIFGEHLGYDCIAHFHCPLLPNHADPIPVVSQRNVECGSHQCGANTSGGLREFVLDNGQVIKAVMLDMHGPNILFRKDTDPGEVIKFIDRNWDLGDKPWRYCNLRYDRQPV